MRVIQYPSGVEVEAPQRARKKGGQHKKDKKDN
jgi:hypothetical protein